MHHLSVLPDFAFNTSRAVRTDAVARHEQLTGMQWDWSNILRGWSGAASAYSPLWAEGFDGAATLVDTHERGSLR